MSRRREIELAAERFDMNNPHVFKKLVEIALEVKRSGRQHFGIAACFERLRWLSTFETSVDLYKLDNSYRAYYSRLLNAVPELRGFFRTRDSAFDPQFHVRVKRHTRGKKPAPTAAPVVNGSLF